MAKPRERLIFDHLTQYLPAGWFLENAWVIAWPAELHRSRTRICGVEKDAFRGNPAQPDYSTRRQMPSRPRRRRISLARRDDWRGARAPPQIGPRLPRSDRSDGLPGPPIYGGSRIRIRCRPPSHRTRRDDSF